MALITVAQHFQPPNGRKWQVHTTLQLAYFGVAVRILLHTFSSCNSNTSFFVKKFLELEKKSVEAIFERFLPKNLKTSQLQALITQSTRTLGIFCLTPFKSHCHEVFKTPLNLIQAIILTRLVAVQSSEIFQISTKHLLNVQFS